ncbi:MAG: hypothetical protein HXY24_13515, partial [Rubrivivax sp.]|nr:hypothetical protein [Rubrivivax sp.]
MALRWLRAPLALCVLALPVVAAPPIMRLSELSPGMKGEGRTVLRGTQVETFPFEVLDVLESDGYTPDLILVRLSGRAIDKFGGIAAGMSGSPL